MAEELSSPNHYVACTGDYDCAADEHIEGCGIVDKRAADEQQHDPHDAAERDLVEFCRKHRAILDSARIYAEFDHDTYYRRGGPVWIYDSRSGSYGPRDSIHDLDG